jgi:hypothetical protein
MSEIVRRLAEWWRAPYTLVWGRYPQRPGHRHTFKAGGYADPDTAGTDAHRYGAHWYQVFDRKGAEVWSSDHDLQAIRGNPS